MKKMTDLCETLSCKPKLIEITNFKSNIKINNLQLIAPIVSDLNFILFNSR